jgi:hypothetical protein
MFNPVGFYLTLIKVDLFATEPTIHNQVLVGITGKLGPFLRICLIKVLN